MLSSKKNKHFRNKFQIIAEILEYCNMVARKSTQMQLKCRLGCKYLEVLQELVTSQLLSRRQIGARYEYITTPTGREWLEHYYALVSILHGRKVLVAKNLENVVRSR